MAGYEALPSMRRVTFAKAYRKPDYWLEWMDTNSLLCAAFFAASMGKPVLAIEKREFGGPLVSRVVHGLDTKDLLERGMAEEFGTAIERQGRNPGEPENGGG